MGYCAQFNGVPVAWEFEGGPIHLIHLFSVCEQKTNLSIVLDQGAFN